MINYVKIAILALQLAGDFARWVEREKVRTDAERALLAEARGMIDANVARADAARDRVRADIERLPGGLRDNSLGPWRDD